MRIAKMPHVHWDAEKKRYVVRRRVPADVQIIVGHKVATHKFRQGIDQTTANDLSVDIVRDWEAEWAAARTGLAPEPVDTPQRGRFVMVSKVSYRLQRPGRPLELTGAPA